MTTTPAPPVCAACGTPGAEWSARLGMPLCAACATAATGAPDRDPVRLGDVLRVMTASLRTSGEPGPPIPPPRPAGAGAVPAPRPPRVGALTTCRRCGSPARWHRTVHGRWVAIEPGERPVAAVPRAERWYVAGDGTAVRLHGPSSSRTCRVAHFSVCRAG
ncbi:DUF6083 domain-containing protein [Streptomyces sp. NPDC015131]|uniref:DUF6083 domain-containing protein n=1 Tax=Streptomyces sp. NPDC015131 TaxID=3364941 RepID=UPI0036F57744